MSTKKKEAPALKRFWCSWWSGNYADEGCTKPPFRFWNSGERPRLTTPDRTDCSLCAVIDVKSENDARLFVEQHFPDHEWRFVVEKPLTWSPEPSRFPPHDG